MPGPGIEASPWMASAGLATTGEGLPLPPRLSASVEPGWRNTEFSPSAWIGVGATRLTPLHTHSIYAGLYRDDGGFQRVCLFWDGRLACMDAFQAGDVVSLKAGGAKMTIVAIDKDKSEATCKWTDKQDKMLTETLPLDALVHVASNDTIRPG